MIIPLALALSVFVPPAGHGDPCPTAPNGAPTWFDFQVERPARYRGGDSTTLAPRGYPARRGVADSAMLVQFVVDTTGVPAPQTFRVLRNPRNESVESARAAVVFWRFEPAMVGTCRVPQLVQTPLERR